MIGKSACSSRRAQFDEQVKGLVEDAFGFGVLAVDLVDDHHGLVAHLQRFLEHETGLRHGAFGGVHQQQHAVHHVHDAFHLAAEIGVAGSIHDIDLDGLAGDRVRDGDGGVLGQDGDAALAFEVIGIHHALGHLLVVAEGMRLAQQPVHQGGLAVVDVGDDGNIAEIGSFFEHSQLSALSSSAIGSIRR